MARPLSIPDRFYRKVCRTIQDHDMVRAKDTVLAAVSGGPDSMALVKALVHLAPDLDIQVGLAHLNHGLRGGDAARDQAFVQAFATAHSLPCFCDTRNVTALAKNRNLSLEEAGRQARYDFFFRTAGDHGYTCIATGHTRDDNAEQILLALVRGTGPTGLSGIPAVRKDRVIRPLIDCCREEIMAFLEAVDLDFVIDASNQDPAFLRNRVRHHLIPLLEKEYNPGIRQGLHRLSRILSEENRFMEDLAGQAFDRCVVKQDPAEVHLSLPALSHLDPALVPRVIRLAIRHVKTDLRRITHDHVTDIRHLVSHAAPGRHLDLPDRIRAYKTRDQLCIRRETLPLRKLGQLRKQGTPEPPKA